MKISTLLIFISTLNLLAGSAYSQSENISLKLAKTYTIENVISEIEKTTDYVFIYNEDVIPALKKEVNVDMSDQSLDEILDQLIKGTDLGYSLSAKQVTLYKDESKKVYAQITSSAPLIVQQPSGKTITGRVVDVNGEAIIGANIIEKGTNNGTITDYDGKFSLNIENNAVLRISYIGYLMQEVKSEGQATINVTLKEDTKTLDELVVVGYGTMKKSDLTGAVSSVSVEKMDRVPNLNFAQLIQGAVPGVQIHTSTAGANSSESFMIRGQNSITASNQPLFILDGIPYNGGLSEINPNNIASIEILKDASSTAIYGSRAANGVILITTRKGVAGPVKVSYNVQYGVQNHTNIPRVLTGPEFYDFKMIRKPDAMTAFEIENYESGKFTDWYKIAMRTGQRQEHMVSLSGASDKINYFISGALLDVKGISKNDKYNRGTGRVNLDVKATEWLSFITRTELSHSNQDGAIPNFENVYYANPLTSPYDEKGNIVIYPWPQQLDVSNPLEATLWDDIERNYQVVTNNNLIVDFPFIKGLKYQLNTGLRTSFREVSVYKGKDSSSGYKVNSSSHTRNVRYHNQILENILSYNNTFNKHNLFATLVYSYERYKTSADQVNASGYPHDLLNEFAISEAALVTPSYQFSERVILSQMLRLNYSYDQRYLVTLTGRRDGYSGFGANTKWGLFPSLALAWRLENEEFFPLKDYFDQFKFRASSGLSGNQAVGEYSTITRLGIQSGVDGSTSIPGYRPVVLGQEDLGWESSLNYNVGLDFSIANSNIFGDLNLFRTVTSDLLLKRSISSVHGLTSITQNIGEVENKGIEFSLEARNILLAKDLTWSGSGNISYMKNKILDLYGDGTDDLNNQWFVGHPINVNYNFVRDGVWQLDEEEEAAKWGQKPGFTKIKDLNDDGSLDADNDRKIIGQTDPKFLWGFNSRFTFKNLSLDVFIHGVHGATRSSGMMVDNVYAQVVRNTIFKDWWTPENPTNYYHKNEEYAENMAGHGAPFYESADFVRFKDIVLSYEFPKHLMQRIGMDRIQLYVSGRNLFTLTNWSGMDPELGSQKNIPLQKEYTIGLNIGF